jgi:hypothetical protein
MGRESRYALVHLGSLPTDVIAAVPPPPPRQTSKCAMNDAGQERMSIAGLAPIRALGGR